MICYDYFKIRQTVAMNRPSLAPNTIASTFRPIAASNVSSRMKAVDYALSFSFIAKTLDAIVLLFKMQTAFFLHVSVPLPLANTIVPGIKPRFKFHNNTCYFA